MTLKLDHDQFSVDKSKMFLYYDRFIYRAKISIDNVQYFRHVKSIEKLWTKIGYLSNMRSTIGISAKDVSEVKKFIEWIENTSHTKEDYWYSSHVNYINFYTNNISIIEELIILLSNEVELCEYQLNRVIDKPKTDRTKIYLVDPKYRYRIYFKWGKTTDIQRNELIEFIESNDIYCSSSFEHWVKKRLNHNYSHYLWDNYFIEFNNEMIITLLSLKFDNIIRKICSVEKR
jgi:hypothetical protein